MYKSARADATSLLALLGRASSHKKQLNTSCTVRMYLNIWPLTKTGCSYQRGLSDDEPSNRKKRKIKTGM